MTPKDKAYDLVVKFQFKQEGIRKELAKRQALIAVDEIIKSNPTDSYSDAFIGTKSYDNSSYWEQVKQEIEKL